jgi:hypothetical protein
MRFARRRVRFGAICFGVCLAVGAKNVDGAAWRCAQRPVEACFRHHGRLSSQNGVALMIWLLGTTRIVRVENEVADLPFGKYLEMTSPDHSYIYGDFEICPLDRDRPGHMRSVCVLGAENLVVQNLQGLRPAFRLLSTWPADVRGGKQKTDKIR